MGICLPKITLKSLEIGQYQITSEIWEERLELCLNSRIASVMQRLYIDEIKNRSLKMEVCLNDLAE